MATHSTLARPITAATCSSHRIHPAKTWDVLGDWCYFPADHEKAIIEFVKGLSEVELSWLIKT